MRERALADKRLIAAQLQIRAIGNEARDSRSSPAVDRVPTVSCPIFNSRFAMMLTMLALPHRSPYPLMQPCTCVAPACTAIRVLPTAVSESLCA